MDQNIKKEKIAYEILEVLYIQSRGRKVTSSPNDNYDLFPDNWYNYDEYESKIEILKEALDKMILIIDTDKYNEESNCLTSNKGGI